MKAARSTSMPRFFSREQTDQEKLDVLLDVSQTVIGLAHSSPILLLLDDLQWFDQASLDLFGHVIFRVADAAVQEKISLLIVGAYRPVGPEERLARLITRLRRETICETLELVGLDEAELVELIRRLGIERPAHQLTVTMAEATQGNPLCTQHLVYHLQQHGVLAERGGYTVTTSAVEHYLPAYVLDTFATRIQTLSAECRQVLMWAALLGESFSLDVLEIIIDMDEDELLYLLEEGMEQHLLLNQDQTFQFAHSLIRHAFTKGMSEPRRQRLHQRIAQALQQLYADDADAHLFEVTYHLMRAGPAVDADLVVQYTRQAGDQAFMMFAWSEAAGYYEASLAVVEGTSAMSLSERAELHYWAGLAYAQNQDIGPCLDHYEKAIDYYRQLDDLRGLARALMEKMRAHYTLESASYGTLMDMRPLEELLEQLDETDDQLRGSIASIMSHVYWTARQTQKATHMAQNALEIGDRLEDDRLRAQASFALGLTQLQTLDLRQTIESWQRALTFAQQANDLRLQGLPLQRLPLVYILLGNLQEATTAALNACELTGKTQEWSYYSIVLSALASVSSVRGDYEEAERYVRETMVMMSRSHYSWGALRALQTLAGLYTQRGDWKAAEGALDAIIEPGHLFPEAGPVIRTFVQAFRYLIHARAGTLERVPTSFITDLIQVVGSDSFSLAPCCAMVEVADCFDDPQLAERPAEVLTMAVNRGVVFAHGWVYLLPRVLGIAAALKGAWGEAQDFLQRAIEIAVQNGAQPEVGRAYLDYARMLNRRRAPGDRAQALEWVHKAKTIFQAFAMEPCLQRAAKLEVALQEHIEGVSPSPVMLLNPMRSQHEKRVLNRLSQRRLHFLG